MRGRRRTWTLLTSGAMLAIVVGASGMFASGTTTYAQAEPTPTPPPGSNPEGHIVEPEKLPWDPSLMANLKLPTGFWIDAWATGMENVRDIVVAPDGTVYVTRREQGDVLALNDRDNDARADQVRTVASGLKYVHGITLHENKLYMATDKSVYVADVLGDGTLGSLRAIITDLPDAGQHPNRTLEFGPDGLLYISVGSTCNACEDTNPENATLLVANPDGSNRRTYAEGLRNTIGFDWHPGSKQLWGMDHGSDWRGDDQPPEELNQIVAGGNYGWPWCYADRKVDEFISGQPTGTTKEAYCAATVPSVLTYTAHSAPLDFRFYTGAQFPAEYSGDAFVTMRGSWNRNPPSGYKVVRVRYQNGWPVAVEDFLTGFLVNNGAAQFGRPVGLAIAPYGSLFITDDTNGVIYRISWAGR